jgi:ABC-type phosphonate transport system ATPase subunit
MIDQVTALEAILGTGAAGGVVLLLKFFAKQGFGGMLDVKEMGARADILEDLRVEIRALRSRVDDLETKVGKLQDRLVVVRTHALTAYGIVQNMCTGCLKNNQAKILLDLLTKIIRED